MASDSFKTINGINGININKVLEFAFFEKSIKYYYDKDEKTFVYLMRKELFEGEANERNRARLKKYEVRPFKGVYKRVRSKK